MGFESGDLPVYVFVSVLGLVYLVRLTWLIATGRCWVGGEVCLRAERSADYWIEVAVYVLLLWWACWWAFAVATSDSDRMPTGAALLLLATIAALIVRALVTGVVSTPSTRFRRTEQPRPYWLFLLGAAAVALWLASRWF